MESEENARGTLGLLQLQKDVSENDRHAIAKSAALSAVPSTDDRHGLLFRKRLSTPIAGYGSSWKNWLRPVTVFTLRPAEPCSSVLEKLARAHQVPEP